jgi:threonine dehydrogenase-like Zn-dependent dehydrogenase
LRFGIDGGKKIQHLDRTSEMNISQISVDPLISHRFPFTQVKEAYDPLFRYSDEAMDVVLLWVSLWN